MLETDLALRKPLRMMGKDADGILPPGGFAAIVARAGVGKTAFLVQLSLNSLLRSINVLHISLNDPINKVNLWYQEVFTHIAQQYNVKQMDALWETLLPHRFIMTFQLEDFSISKLQERLTDLMKQQIFIPQMLIIDGLPFDNPVRSSFLKLKTWAKNQALHVWFTIRIHRHEAPGPDGSPVQMKSIADLFELILQLQSKGKEIHIVALKGENMPPDKPALLLDPATMLIKNPDAPSQSSDTDTLS